MKPHKSMCTGQTAHPVHRPPHPDERPAVGVGSLREDDGGPPAGLLRPPGVGEGEGEGEALVLLVVLLWVLVLAMVLVLAI